jgi:ferredoxin
MSADIPDGNDVSLPDTNPSEPPRPDLKRTLKDLLVQDEVSDSDVEMLEKHATEEETEQNDDVIDPDMCVECGDQVRTSKILN